MPSVNEQTVESFVLALVAEEVSPDAIERAATAAGALVTGDDIPAKLLTGVTPFGVEAQLVYRWAESVRRRATGEDPQDA